MDDRDLDPRARGPVRLFVTRRSRTGTNDHRATSILARENRLVLAPVVVVVDLVVLLLALVVLEVVLVMVVVVFFIVRD